jgi:hypothetical protein
VTIAIAKTVIDHDPVGDRVSSSSFRGGIAPDALNPFYSRLHMSTNSTVHFG